MQTKWLAVMMLAGTSLFAGTPFSVGIGIGVPVYAPPPPVVYYAPPPCPGPGYTWVAGYWYPAGPHYYWHAGYWARPPYAGGYWVGPRYYGHHYYGGYWAHRGRGHEEHWDHGRHRGDER